MTRRPTRAWLRRGLLAFATILAVALLVVIPDRRVLIAVAAPPSPPTNAPRNIAYQIKRHSETKQPGLRGMLRTPIFDPSSSTAYRYVAFALRLAIYAVLYTDISKRFTHGPFS